MRAIVVFILFLVFGLASISATEARKEITDARAILDLTPEAAENRQPVHLKGIVTCIDGSTSLWFVQDKTAGVYIWGPGPLPELGDIIEVTGSSGKGLFSPIVLADRTTVIGHGQLPLPSPMAVEQLATGRHDSQWVEVEGVVVREEKNWGQLVLTLASGTSRLEVRILRGDLENPPDYVDVRVKIRGVAGTAYNPRRQLTGFHLLTQNTNLITILERPPADPFAGELRQSGKMMAYSRQGASEHRMRLRGVVTFYWPGQDFYIRDESGGVRVQSRQGTPLNPGDLIDVVGFPSPGAARPALLEAIYRKVGAGVEPMPRTIHVADGLSGEQESEVVSIEGKVLQASESHEGYSALVLEADQKVFRACYRNEWGLGKDPFLVGGMARVTGICAVDPPRQATAEMFSIWMRQTSDFQLTARPPAWRQRQTMLILGGLAGGVALAGAWVALLRVRVRQQTDAIRKREKALEDRYVDLFENSNDIIYAHDLNGAISSMNNSGQAALGYTHGELLRMKISDLIDPEDAELAQRQTRAKMEGTPRTAYELRVRAKNGQRLTLEINSRIIYKDGAPVGVQGIARDITARKAAEEALRLSERQLRMSMEERERIARDLHDGIIQSIYATGLTIDDCARVVERDPAGVERRLRKVTADLNRVIREVRDFILGLERHRLKGDEFKGALKSLALSLGESQPTRIELAIEDSASSALDSAQATQLLHVAREALTNAVKHAKAPKVTFQLRRSATGVTFEVADDGVGFNPQTCAGKGFGLRNMAARAAEIHAEFKLLSQNGEGTRIVLDIPCKTSEQFQRENPLAHR